MGSLSSFKNLTDKFPLQENPFPVLFIGHGNPMNAMEDNEFTRDWKKIAGALPVPKAVLCISAHWFINSTRVTAMPNPRTIYDFYGFPRELYQQKYSAPGAPELAGETKQMVDFVEIELDHEWGLDHGTWSVLKVMYPEARIPVYQLSIDYRKDGQWHLDLASQLKELRKKQVLIIGSGNIVHNLGMANLASDSSYEWAREFDQKSKDLILKRDYRSLANYKSLGEAAKLSIPTPDHYFPLLYTLGLSEAKEEIAFYNEKCMAGSISMRSLRIG